MKCPLIAIGYLASERLDAAKKCECGKEKCGCWDKVLKQCVALSIGDWLENIHSILSGMLGKMPHAGQFKK